MTDKDRSGGRITLAATAPRSSLLHSSSQPYLVRGIMSRAKKSLPPTRALQSVVSRQNDPRSGGVRDEVRSIQADVQLLLEISKRKRALETIRPRTASVTPTLNLVLARARDTARILTIQLQNDTGENTRIRTYAISISQLLAFDVSSTLPGCLPPSFRLQATWKRPPGSQKDRQNTNPYHSKFP
jgi:hypothetical protein